MTIVRRRIVTRLINTRIMCCQPGIDNAFGKILRQHRKKVGVSQEQLANLANLDRTYISLLERGKRQPSLKTIFLISSVLNILPSELIYDVEQYINIKLNKLTF
jgi:transcriptional regulator with XRE-family HTH domain